MILRDDVKEKLFEGIKVRDDDWRRSHLGASAIGEDCERKVWFDFRWFTNPNFSGRILALFRRGHEEEKFWHEDLNSIEGFKFLSEDSTNKQFSFSRVSGHFGGSIDGALYVEKEKQWYLVEIKTYNKTRFAQLQKKGVEVSDPKYATQVQMYMGLSNLDRVLFCATCKDSDDKHIEEIKAEKGRFEEGLAKAERIIFSKKAPPKISENPAYFSCKWCPHYAICHLSDSDEVKADGFSRGRVEGFSVSSLGTKKFSIIADRTNIEINCRTCNHSEPIHDDSHNEGEAGKWVCAHGAGEKLITIEDQKTGCDKHTPLL